MGKNSSDIANRSTERQWVKVIPSPKPIKPLPDKFEKLEFPIMEEMKKLESPKDKHHSAKDGSFISKRRSL